MEIINIKVLKGPNYWSNFRKKLIVIKLDLKRYEDLPTDELPGFTDNLKKLIPSLYAHRCSPGYEGGFFERLARGTWLGHVIEHIALELQWLAGMECGYGRTRPTGQRGVYNVVYAYEIENAGIYAGKAAIAIADALANNQPYTQLEEDINTLKEIYYKEGFGPSTKAIIEEAQKRDIPYTRLNNDSLVMLGQGCHQQLICSSATGLTSGLGIDLVTDKEYTKDLLAAAMIPVPKGIVVKSLAELEQAITELGFPLVIKPQFGNHGKGITTNVVTKEKAISGFNIAQQVSNTIIVEKFVTGSDYRLLVINSKLVAAAQRTPAMVVGDDRSTIEQLINEVNEDQNRGEDHQNVLTKIAIDEVTKGILRQKALTLNSILPRGEILYLKHAANLSSGGTATDVTDTVHPQNIFLAERIARLVNLDICGIDIVTKDIAIPITEGNGAVIEVNASPGFRMHLAPTKGVARNVAKSMIDMLYPENKPARIPIVAVTGSNGKTTVVRLVSYFAKQAGCNVGTTTTEGISINDHEIYQGDCSGPVSARAILRDPLVNFAVLECARGGILRSGLGFDKCDISIITSISEDHLGIDDINTLEELARVKSVVAKSTAKEGYAILNADDDLVYAIKNDLECNIALFAMSRNERVALHCQQGGIAAYTEGDNLIVEKGTSKDIIANFINVPLTFSGTATCMIKNILPAVLAGLISNFTGIQLAQWLENFEPTAENIPGRLNLFNFKDFKVLVDYAHNEEAFIELNKFINKMDSQKKVGIIAATGDRRPEDIRKVGYYAAQVFDEIIIRLDDDSRGKTNDVLIDLIKEGIEQIKSPSEVKVIPNEFDAIQYAMDNAIPDTFIMYFPDDVLRAVDFVKKATQTLNVQNQVFQNQESA